MPAMAGSWAALESAGRETRAEARSRARWRMPAMRFIHPVLTLQPVETQLVVALSLDSKTCELKAGELKTGAGWKLNWRQF